MKTMELSNKKKIILAAGVGAALATAAYMLWPRRDIPRGASAVQPFDMDRYFGTWHEIARLPNSVEEHVLALTETYTRRPDGLIGVITRAFDTRRRRWVKAIGKAKLAAKQGMGQLKVSYFGPFYFPYNVLDIDENYRYALASGSNLDQLWILSREKTIPEVILQRFLN